jgi:WD40 repeat protein
VNTGKELRAFVGNTNTVKCAVFSVDDRYVISGGLDHTIRMWKVPET